MQTRFQIQTKVLQEDPNGTESKKAFGVSKPKAQKEYKTRLILCLPHQDERTKLDCYFFFSSFPMDPADILLTLLDRHLGQARSTMGPLGSKGILNSCPHRKHLKVASSATFTPI